MSLSGGEKAYRLQKALDWGGPTHRLDDVVRMLKAGEARLWERGDGCIITEFHDYPLHKAVHYWLIFGELRDCLALEHEINPWAIENGCSVATGVGRPGWGRVLPPGWRPWRPNFIKPLSGDAP